MPRHTLTRTRALSRLGPVSATAVLGACQLLTGADDFSARPVDVAPFAAEQDASADAGGTTPDTTEPTPDAFFAGRDAVRPALDPCAGVDLSSDPEHCGVCRHACKDAEVCRSGECIERSRIATCDDGEILCNAQRVGQCDALGAPMCCLEGEIVCPDAQGAGHCISGASSCARVAFCDDGVATCGPNQTPACRPDGSGALCCGAATRACFRPDLTRDGPFETCLANGRRCQDVIECPDETAACSPTAQPYCELDGTVGCCGETQFVCDRPDLGLRACVDSPEACASAIACGGRLRSCAPGETPNCSSTNELVCCGGEFFFFCDRPDIGSQGCWNAVTDCSTVTFCNGGWHACGPASPPAHFDCNTEMCVQ